MLRKLLTFRQSDGCDCLTRQDIAIVGAITFAALGKLCPEDRAQAKALVRPRAEQEKSQRSTG